ncbi:MAG: HAMP domain-containing histidine kinase [Burkholderiaceae bacterium]|jgi:two-component system sensor histidine kinase TctE|nr:HAMP domain-containing histidine kinase [Burkholderiaceae bacterium]
MRQPLSRGGSRALPPGSAESLAALAARIRARPPDDFSPLDASAVSKEVAPLVDAFNDWLARIGAAVEAQKHFLACATHQLKTPLAGLRLQADLARREGGSAEALKAALAQMGLAADRAAHTVDQMLALARVEAGAAVAGNASCDLAALTIAVVREAVPRALARRVDLGYEGPAPGAAPQLLLPGNPALLTQMIGNLVENALLHAPAGGAPQVVVTARVMADPRARQLAVQVEDNGPGVPESERALVFQPFYRAAGAAGGAEGSGLGLSIVAEIARRHGGCVAIQPARPGQNPPGACFTVRFAMPKNPLPAAARAGAL